MLDVLDRFKGSHSEIANELRRLEETLKMFISEEETGGSSKETLSSLEAFAQLSDTDIRELLGTEEESLIPALQQIGKDEIAESMKKQHDDIKDCEAKFRCALAGVKEGTITENKETLHDEGFHLIELLQNYFDEQDNIVLEILDSELSEEQKADLQAKLS